jgi:hypothetical protein
MILSKILDCFGLTEQAEELKLKIMSKLDNFLDYLNFEKILFFLFLCIIGSFAWLFIVIDNRCIIIIF